MTHDDIILELLEAVKKQDSMDETAPKIVNSILKSMNGIEFLEACTFTNLSGQAYHQLLVGKVLKERKEMRRRTYQVWLNATWDQTHCRYKDEPLRSDFVYVASVGANSLTEVFSTAQNDKTGSWTSKEHVSSSRNQCRSINIGDMIIDDGGQVYYVSMEGFETPEQYRKNRY